MHVSGRDQASADQGGDLGDLGIDIATAPGHAPWRTNCTARSAHAAAVGDRQWETKGEGADRLVPISADLGRPSTSQTDMPLAR